MTRAEGDAETETIITTAMERTGDSIMEVRPIYAAKEIAAKLGRVTRTTAYDVSYGWRSGSKRNRNGQ